MHIAALSFIPPPSLPLPSLEACETATDWVWGEKLVKGALLVVLSVHRTSLVLALFGRGKHLGFFIITFGSLIARYSNGRVGDSDGKGAQSIGRPTWFCLVTIPVYSTHARANCSKSGFMLRMTGP